ncbi:MAG: alcohol dehydrogenase catalytic domain-containing protein [Spirochaetes bacterium]|nr:alcohol dehydrogenase catalytic domain-containing protein [Spirochaetota bacterium]
MKAYVFTRYQHIEPMQYDTPAPPEEHALIKLTHCGISQMDVDTYLGREQKVVPPKVLGSEICGTVIKINSSDTLDKLEGVNVAVDPVISCGYCNECVAGNGNHCENIEVIGFTCDGGFAEYVIVPVKNIYPLPDIGDMECFTLAGALASAIHLDSTVRLKKGGQCVILGSRPFEILCGLVLLRRSGVSVIIIDDNLFRLNIAQSLGLTCIYLSGGTLNNMVDESYFENDKRVDTVIIGSSQIQNSLYLGIELVRPRGHILFTRNIRNDECLESVSILEKELVITGVNLYMKEDFKRSIDDIAIHADNYSSLITHRLPFAGISSGLQILKTVSECMQVILVN